MAANNSGGNVDTSMGLLWAYELVTAELCDRHGNTTGMPWDGYEHVMGLS